MGEDVENLDAVTRLISVLNNTESLQCFLKALSQPKESEQSIHFTTVILQILTNSCTLSAQEYSANLLKKYSLLAVVDFDYIGMGYINTWHGSPDCLTNIAPSQVKVSISEGDVLENQYSSVTSLSVVPSIGECTDNTSEESFGARTSIPDAKRR